MSPAFKPRMEILPPGQQSLWPQLRNAPMAGFTLYGGTAIGMIAFGRVGEPEYTEDGVLQVASFDDLMATKLKVILLRAEAKDYRDIAAMVRAGVSVSRGLASARLLFGPNFQPSESLKALTYFKDGDLHLLTSAEQNTLVDAVKAVRDLPDVSLLSTRLSKMG